MSSQAQIDANRVNAQKSTGPTSPEGKAASSLNALKSGIDAHSHIIRGEDPAELEALTTAFLRQFQPADPNQLALVDTLIAAEWTQRRLRCIEAQLWAWQIERLDKYLPQAERIDDSLPQNSLLGHVYQNGLETLTRLGRRMDATNRTYLRTLQALQALQKAPVELSPTSTSPTSTPTERTQPLTSPIGFVPPFLTLAIDEPTSQVVAPAIWSPVFFAGTCTGPTPQS
jgi:hypothetical protein